MKPILIASSLAAAVAIAASSTAYAGAADLSSCCAPADKDFPKVAGNLGNQGFSSLTQINKDNVNKLGPVWLNHVSAAPVTTPVPGPGTSDTGQQTTPIAIDGVIYMDTPNGDVIAIDGKTGQTKWKWHPTAFNTSGTRRGVSVGDGKVYTLAGGQRVVALDKETGAEVWVSQPTGPGGETLGNIQKVATIYYDGLVYLGGNDGRRNAAFAVRSSDGSLAWYFYGGAEPGRVVTDVNGVTVDAGATWGPPVNGESCALTGGVSPWIHPSLDPELGMVYYAFGNVRSCRSSQDGELRPGDNLFGNSLVALDLKTGEYKWHFQSIRHDHWDMDNTSPPPLADLTINGETKKVIYYGAKAPMTFIIDRTNGKPIAPVVDRPRPTDSRQSSATMQKFPAQGMWIPECVIWEKLDPANIPGNPWRGVPNYNGYQPDASGNLVYTEPNYLSIADTPFVTYPAEYGATHRKGCLFDDHWDLPVLSTTSQNGGADWTDQAYSPKTGLVYIPYGVNNVAHDRNEGGNGLRALGQYQTGGLVALNATSGEVVWRNHFGLDAAHGQHPLVTGSNMLFIGDPAGWLRAMDAATGQELWKFQTGFAISSGAITYTIDGEQYVAVFASGTGIPYGNSITEGDTLWAFKLGGGAKYTDAAGNVVSGSSEAPTPGPLNIRRPVSGSAVEGSTVHNTVYLGRNSRNDVVTARDSTSTSGMNPTSLRVPVGTTVTFLNPGSSTFPNFPNVKPHCATQFFEGAFNFKLNPGESAQYTFTREGEYFFNDCTDPRPTGKVVAYHVPIDVPGAVQFTPGTLKLGAANGVFTGVNGVVTAHMDIPDGYTVEGDVKLKTPLSATLFSPVSTNAGGGGKKLVAQFNKADIDNNTPEGDSVPLVLTVNVLQNGVQKQLTSTALVKVEK
ncbi:MAG TPA: PQQ-binding-like beta-propeller repeat protein [Casimicrobiaceae bacterium]|nr:PQQ-binding-like beta-propeller repeat protein [Casimicrobiaceae bacterium]